MAESVSSGLRATTTILTTTLHPYHLPECISLKNLVCTQASQIFGGFVHSFFWTFLEYPSLSLAHTTPHHPHTHLALCENTHFRGPPV